MGLKSLEQSYLADAHRYLTLANQQAPDDAEVQYGLGVVENLRGAEWGGGALVCGGTEIQGLAGVGCGPNGL